MDKWKLDSLSLRRLFRDQNNVTRDSHHRALRQRGPVLQHYNAVMNATANFHARIVRGTADEIKTEPKDK